MIEKTVGWNWLAGVAKWHYFIEDGQSLCGRWLIWSNNSDAQDYDDDAPKNCKACQRKLLKRREKANEQRLAQDNGQEGLHTHSLGPK